MKTQDRIKEVYQRSKDNAKSRGIGWGFTRETWVKWWVENLGPDWLTRRGARNDQYCMGRKGDRGPYDPWNVECITNAQNHSDRAIGKNGSAPRGSKVGTSKLTTKQARGIYTAKSTLADLAKRHGVGITAIQSIKTKRCWGHSTNDLGVAHRNKIGRAPSRPEWAEAKLRKAGYVWVGVGLRGKTTWVPPDGHTPTEFELGLIQMASKR